MVVAQVTCSVCNLTRGVYAVLYVTDEVYELPDGTKFSTADVEVLADSLQYCSLLLCDTLFLAYTCAV